MPEASADPRVQIVSWGWWFLVLIGVLSIAAGVIVIVEPGISLLTLATVTGIFLLIDGLMEVIIAVTSRGMNRGMVAVFGVISAIVGIILIRHPVATVVAIALLLGIWLVVSGVLRLMRVFDESENRVWTALMGLLELVGGIVIVAVPGIGVATLALLIGIALIVRGAAAMALGWGLRSLRA